MRKVTSMRLGIAAMVCGVGAAGALIAGCSDDDVSSTPTTDSGVKDSTATDAKLDSTADTGPAKDGGDAGPAADTGTTTDQSPKLILVHASPDLPPVRFCFLAPSANTAGPFPALPNTAGGLPPGFGGVVPKLTLPITPFDIIPVAIPASELASQQQTDGGSPLCTALINVDGTIKADAGITTAIVMKDSEIPANTLKTGNTYLLAAVGCLPNAADNTGSVAKCGSDYSPDTGNFKIKVLQLDRTVIAADAGIGAQFAHLSSETEGLVAPAGLIPSFFVPGTAFDAGTVDTGAPDTGAPDTGTVDSGTPDAGDAGDAGDATTDATTTDATVADSSAPADTGAAGDGAVPPIPDIPIPLTTAFVKYIGNGDGGVTSLATFNGISPTTSKFGIILPLADGGLAPQPGSPLPAVSQLSGGTAFVNGNTYTFVAVGRPGVQVLQTDGGINGNGLHFLAFPNDPVVLP